MTSRELTSLPHAIVPLALGLVFCVATPALSAPLTRAPAQQPAPAAGIAEALHSPPAGLEDPALQPRWRAALEHESNDRFQQAATAYEDLIRDAPGVSYLYWKVARNTWRLGEATHIDDKQQRLRHFESARDWAARGLETDSGCAACMRVERRADTRAATEARAVLPQAAGLPHVLNTDAIDVEHAAMLLESPDSACGYSRDGWIDVGEN